MTWTNPEEGSQDRIANMLELDDDGVQRHAKAPVANGVRPRRHVRYLDDCGQQRSHLFDTVLDDREAAHEKRTKTPTTFCHGRRQPKLNTTERSA
jgi:hypothetical protein